MNRLSGLAARTAPTARPAPALAPQRRPLQIAPKTVAAPKPSTLAAWHELSSLERSLFPNGARDWAKMDREQKGIALLLIRKLEANGIDLTGMKLKDPAETTRPNRILFEPGPALDKFQAQLQAGRDDGRFVKDDPFDLFHWGMASDGARENTVKWSMQIGIGPKGAFVDVDRYNPWLGFKAWLGHTMELLVPGKPSPFQIARESDISLRAA